MDSNYQRGHGYSTCGMVFGSFPSCIALSISFLFCLRHALRAAISGWHPPGLLPLTHAIALHPRGLHRCRASSSSFNSYFKDIFNYY